jgi:hypothetical protein
MKNLRDRCFKCGGVLLPDFPFLYCDDCDIKIKDRPINKKRVYNDD